MSRYVVHREPQWHLEGFRNTGNTSYINSCLQVCVLLSTSRNEYIQKGNA